MKKLLLPALALLFAHTVSLAQTYGGSYYFSSFQSIPQPQESTVFGNNNEIIGFPDINVTNFSVTLIGGTMAGCAEYLNPTAYLSTYGGELANIPLTNGFTHASVPVSYSSSDPGILEVWVQGEGSGSTCRVVGGIGGSQNLQVVMEVEYQLAGDLWPHFGTSYWDIINPVASRTIKATFDNPLESHGWQSLPPAVGVFDYIDLQEGNFSLGEDSVGYLENAPGETCEPYWSVTSASQSSGNFDYNPPPFGIGSYITGLGALGSSTPNGAPVVMNSFFGPSDGCADARAAYVEDLMYAVDSGNSGPFYMTSFVENISPSQHGLIEVAEPTPSSQTGIHLLSLRGAIVGGLPPSGCTTYPTVEVLSGSTELAKASFDSSGDDALWTGSVSIPSGSEIEFDLNPGSGCTSLGEFNIIASYSTP
jgi:hypothetical protein